jgi:hypothetical protein
MKNFHGLGRAKGYGIKSLALQVKLTALAVNLKRIAAVLSSKKGVYLKLTSIFLNFLVIIDQNEQTGQWAILKRLFNWSLPVPLSLIVKYLWVKVVILQKKNYYEPTSTNLYQVGNPGKMLYLEILTWSTTSGLKTVLSFV